MDEQKIRMRQEMIKQARQGRAINRKKSPPTPGKQFFLFRIYVTMMLVGAAVVLSLFDTNTANTITESLKEAIAYEMPLQQWKQKALTVFEQKTTQSQQTQENEQIQQDTQTQQQTQDNAQTQQTTKNNSTNTFQPDLSENSGKIP